MRYRYLLVGLLILPLAGCYSGTHPPGIGTQAPDFTIQDGDHKVSLSDFRGKVVVLNFWATWCPPCLEETPSLEQLQQRLRNRGVVVLGVSWDADDAAYHKFLRDNNIDFVTVREGDPNTGNRYGTIKIPESYVIDRKGKIRRKFISSVNWNDPDIVAYLSQL